MQMKGPFLAAALGVWLAWATVRLGDPASSPIGTDRSNRSAESSTVTGTASPLPPHRKARPQRDAKASGSTHRPRQVPRLRRRDPERALRELRALRPPPRRRVLPHGTARATRNRGARTSDHLLPRPRRAPQRGTGRREQHSAGERATGHPGHIPRDEPHRERGRNEDFEPHLGDRPRQPQPPNRRERTLPPLQVCGSQDFHPDTTPTTTHATRSLRRSRTRNRKSGQLTHTNHHHTNRGLSSPQPQQRPWTRRMICP